MLASMAGYALARIRIPGSNLVTAFIMITLMIPGSVTFVPTFVVVGALGGVNTHWGIIAPGLFNAFAVLLFRNFYLRFPTELEEAGRLDGLGHLGVYWRIALPNSTTMIASLGALSFIESWNAFLWPLIIGQDPPPGPPRSRCPPSSPRRPSTCPACSPGRSSPSSRSP